MKEALVNKIKNQDGIFVIAGPCSAETASQVSTIAKDIVATQKVNMLRAGIWKPRTHPNSFEGLGLWGGILSKSTSSPTHKKEAFVFI
jgi:chorismate mutase